MGNSETDGERGDGDRREGRGSMSGRLKSSLAVDAMRMVPQNYRPARG